jgi:uncharacterized coiled-coil protein SlyX
MPISPNNLQFSLPSEYIERLRAKSHEGESIGLTAKRIIIAALDADREKINSSQLTELLDRIEALEVSICMRNTTFDNFNDHIAAIEVAIDSQQSPPDKISDRLTTIEEALAALQYQVNQITSPVKRTSSPPPRPPRRK